MIIKTKDGEYVNLADVMSISVQTERTRIDNKDEWETSYYAALWIRNSSLNFRLCEGATREILQTAIDNLMLRLCELSEQKLVDMGDYV